MEALGTQNNLVQVFEIILVNFNEILTFGTAGGRSAVTHYILIVQ